MQQKSIILVLIIMMTINIACADGKFFRGGAGGFEMINLPLDLPKIDTKLNQISLSELEDNIYLTGGGGWGNVGNNIRIGGYGYGGSIPAINSKTDQLTREFTMDIDLGGVAIEKAFQPLKNSEINLSCIVGAGSINIGLKQWSRFTSWDDLWADYELESNGQDTPVAYKSELKTSFFMATPSIGIRYYLLDWFAVGAHVGYLYTHMVKDNWDINGSDLYQAPKLDLSNTFYKVNFFFGG